MALPTDLSTLDYADGGLPLAGGNASAALPTSSLDVASCGLPFAMNAQVSSTDNARITQVVTEYLRDATDPGGGNLRATVIAREVLIGSFETVYLTALAMERLSRSSAQSAKGTSWMVFDEVNHLDVTMRSGVLTSAADDYAVLNGTNLALWGQELLGFKTVQDLGGGRYRLSYLLRGRYGTEWAMRSHTAGDPFVLMNTTTISRSTQGQADIGAGKQYRAVTIGQAIDQAVTRAFANTAAGLKPYAPCGVASSRDGSSNLTITWYRRTRYDGEWRDAVDAALGETSEAYEVDILSATGAVLRTIASTTPTAAYSAAQQTTDFGAAQPIISVVIYQRSSIVGRGYGTASNV